MASRLYCAQRKLAGYLAGTYVLQLVNLGSLVLERGIWILKRTACSFCTFTSWFNRDNYRYHTKYLKDVSPKKVVLWERGRKGIKV